MGWRFRRVFGAGPFRWTLSKRGVGASVGLGGVRFGVSPDGRRYMSFGLPGTGLYWIKYFGEAIREQQPGMGTAPSPLPPSMTAPGPLPATSQSPPPATSQVSPVSGQRQHSFPWWRQRGL